MKKWIISSVILVIILFANKANGQTYTQTFIDKCTGEVKVATTTYINGNAVVSFYNQTLSSLVNMGLGKIEDFKYL